MLGFGLYIKKILGFVSSIIGYSPVYWETQNRRNWEDINVLWENYKKDLIGFNYWEEQKKEYWKNIITTWDNWGYAVGPLKMWEDINTAWENIITNWENLDR